MGSWKEKARLAWKQMARLAKGNDSVPDYWERGTLWAGVAIACSFGAMLLWAGVAM